MLYARMVKKTFPVLILAISAIVLLLNCDGSGGSGNSNNSSELDYSQPGNPPEVQLTPQEYLPGDELYTKNHPDYYKDGENYLTAEIENKIRNLWSIHKGKKIMSNRLDMPSEYLNADNLFFINSGNKRKEIDEAEITNYFSYIRNPLVTNLQLEALTTNEKQEVTNFISKFITLLVQYRNENKQARERLKAY